MSEISRLYAKIPDVQKSNSVLRIQRTKSSQPIKSPADRILFLQRTIGNQAVQRLIRSGTLQAKLRIGQPGDKYEQEADRVADAVMRMPEPGVQRQVEPEEEEETLQSKPLANQITPLVQVQRQEEPEEEEEMLQAKPLAEEITRLVQRQVEPEEEEEEELQAKATSGNISEANPNLESDIQSLKGGGQPLSENDRTFFEPRFGHDFSQVRMHTDTRAAESARAVNARAFTAGRDVVFGAGKYAPGTSEGRKLIAHEFTHVIQQTARLENVPDLYSHPMKILRQTIPIPIFNELDPCIIVPSGLPKPFDKLKGKKVCGSHAKKVRDKIKEIFGSKKEKKVFCPPGFKPASMKEFKGLCCKGSIHNKESCCPYEQIVMNPFESKCCPEGTIPDTEKKKCVKTPTFSLCPADRSELYTCLCLPEKRKNLLKGICCPEGQEGQSGECKVPSKPPETTPPVSPTSIPKDIQIFFKKERPKPGESGKEHLNNSLTITGRKQLERLVAQIRQNPTFRVQLVGKASPEGTSKFNLDLGARRAKIIAEALINEGIDRTRFMNLKVSECKVLGEGLVTCGEAGATGPSDRQVLAKIFIPKLE
jgi:hypothetical protein